MIQLSYDLEATSKRGEMTPHCAGPQRESTSAATCTRPADLMRPNHNTPARSSALHQSNKSDSKHNTGQREAMQPARATEQRQQPKTKMAPPILPSLRYVSHPSSLMTTAVIPVYHWPPRSPQILLPCLVTPPERPTLHCLLADLVQAAVELHDNLAGTVVVDNLKLINVA